MLRCFYVLWQVVGMGVMKREVLIRQIDEAWAELLALISDNPNRDLGPPKLLEYELARLEERISNTRNVQDLNELAESLNGCKHYIRRLKSLIKSADSLV